MMLAGAVHNPSTLEVIGHLLSCCLSVVTVALLRARRVELLPLARGRELPQPHRQLVQCHVGNRTLSLRDPDERGYGPP